jgi:hypothetical protein
MYRYWWFENSGNYSTATCHFISEDVLAMNWHDSVLFQTFVRKAADTVALTMAYPLVKSGHEPVLKVLMTKRIQ